MRGQATADAPTQPYTLNCEEPLMAAARATTDRVDPLRGGVSIGPCRIAAAGTLGVVVIDRDSGDPMVLSNFHVLAFDNDFAVGDEIVQPAGGDDGGTCPDDVVATLERAVLDGRVDGAVARITARRNACSLLDLGNVGGSRDAALDMQVRKSGRTTGVTKGHVESVDATINVPYEGIGEVTFIDQIEVAAGAPAVVVQPGFFIAAAWSTGPLATVGAVKVERITTGPFPGIAVTGPTGSVFHTTLAGNVSRYVVFGSPARVLILESTTAAGPVTHRVSVVDLNAAPPQELPILAGTASSAAVQLPVVQHSQGSGSVFLIYSSSGTQVQNLVMRRSDDGKVLCPGPPPFVATGETRGEASATELIIHYSSGQTSREVRCSLLPEGETAVFLLNGDSGSVVVDDSRRVVGLVFAANEDELDENGDVIVPAGRFGYANPIDAVLDALDVRLCQPAGGGGGGGGGGGDGGPLAALRALDLAQRCLDRIPPVSLRRDLFDADDASPLSLRERLLAVKANC